MCISEGLLLFPTRRYPLSHAAGVHYNRAVNLPPSQVSPKSQPISFIIPLNATQNYPLTKIPIIYIYIFYSKRIPKKVFSLKINKHFTKKKSYFLEKKSYFTRKKSYFTRKKKVILLIKENLYIPSSTHASTTHGIYECALHNKIGMFIRHCALSKVF